MKDRKAKIDRMYLFLCLLFSVGLAVITTACGNENKEKHTDLWSPGLPSLCWGMSPEEVQQFYEFEGEGVEISEHMYQYSLKDSVELFGCRLQVALVFEETRGLERVEAYTDQEETLQNALHDFYGEYRLASDDGKKLEWESEAVGSQYDEEEIRTAYQKVLGDIPELESIIKGTLGGSMTRVVLYISGGKAGTLVIDGHGQNTAEWLMTQLKAE